MRRPLTCKSQFKDVADWCLFPRTQPAPDHEDRDSISIVGVSVAGEDVGEERVLPASSCLEDHSIHLEGSIQISVQALMK